jgi:hypothetical protein
MVTIPQQGLVYGWAHENVVKPPPMMRLFRVPEQRAVKSAKDRQNLLQPNGLNNQSEQQTDE